MSRLLFLFIWLMVGSACKGHQTAAVVVPPTQLIYAVNPATYLKGVPITVNTTTTKGGRPTSFTVAPALPSGLLLDPTTGQISGTPLVAQTVTPYTVVAKNSAGDTSVVLTITIPDQPPVLSFSGSPYNFALDQPATTGQPTNSGGAIISCALDSASPALPSGLTLDGHDCRISGSPTVTASAATYLIDVAYQGGVAFASVVFSVYGPLSVNAPHITINIANGYSYTFAGQNGVPPYHFNLVSGPGSIDANSGLYQAGQNAGVATITVSDSASESVQATATNIQLLTNGPVNAVAQAGNNIYLGGSFTRVAPLSAPAALAVDQTTGAPQLSFDVQSGFDGSVLAIAATADALYVGGSFNHYQGHLAPHIAKLDFDGDLDTTFASNVGSGLTGGEVRLMTITPSGIAYAGDFDSWQGQAVSQPVVLTTEGQLDASFAATIGSGVAGSDLTTMVTAIDGSLYLGGTLTSFDGQTVAPGLIHLTSGGSLDLAFNSNLGLGFGTVDAIAVAPDGIFVGGAFTGGLTELLTSGVVDSEFSIGAGFNGTVESLAWTAEALFASGTFTNYRTYPVGSGLIKIDLAQPYTGLLDTTFNQAIGQIPIEPVQGLVTTDDGLFLLGEQLLKLDLAGSLSGTFVAGSGLGFDSGGVRAIAVSANTLYVGGEFSHYQGTASPTLAQMSLAGTFAPDFAKAVGSGFDQPVVTLAANGDTGVFVGGSFSHFNGTAAGNLASVLATGALDPNFPVAGFTSTTSRASTVECLATTPTALFVGGYFDGYGGQAVAPNIAKIALTVAPGSLDSAFNTVAGTGLRTTPSSLVGDALAMVGDGGNGVYVGGSFAYYDANSFPLVVDINADGTAGPFKVPTLAGTGAEVTSLVLSDELYVGGTFTSPVPYLAAFTSGGQLDTHFNQTLLNGSVTSLALDGSALFVGTNATSFQATAIGHVVEISLAAALLPGFSTVSATGIAAGPASLLVSGSSLWVGGSFNQYASQPAADADQLSISQ